MTMKGRMLSPTSERIYRVDTFDVPDRAHDEFLDRVRSTHVLLRTLPGFVQDFVLERPSDSGEFRIVTIAEWEGEEFIAGATAAVKALHEEMNFNPQELFERLSVRADRAIYRQSDADS